MRVDGDDDDNLAGDIQTHVHRRHVYVNANSERPRNDAKRKERATVKKKKKSSSSHRTNQILVALSFFSLSAVAAIALSSLQLAWRDFQSCFQFFDSFVHSLLLRRPSSRPKMNL